MAKSVNKSAETDENKKMTENNGSANNTNKSVETKVVAIPVDSLNKKNNTVKVTINGKETKIKRGVQQTVSKDVYDRLVIAGYVIEG